MSDKNNYFYKQNVESIEYEIHKMVYNHKIVNTPIIYDYDEITKILTMEKIPEMCIADMYGEKPEDIPTEIFDLIRETITILYCNGVEYPDVTGYNFIYHNNKLWIIDYGHAFIRTKETNNEYLLEFMFQGINEWNPEFL